MPRVSFCAPASPRPASGWVDRREHFTERGGPTAIPGARRQRAACALQRLALLTDLRFGRPAPLPFFAQLGARWTPAAAALPHLDLYRRHDAAARRHPLGDLRAHPRLDQSTALSTWLWFLATLLLTLPTLREVAGSDRLGGHRAPGFTWATRATQSEVAAGSAPAPGTRLGLAASLPGPRLQRRGEPPAMAWARAGPCTSHSPHLPSPPRPMPGGRQPVCLLGLRRGPSRRA